MIRHTSSFDSMWYWLWRGRWCYEGDEMVRHLDGVGGNGADEHGRRRALQLCDMVTLSNNDKC